MFLAGAMISCGDDGEDESLSCWCVPDVKSIKIVPEKFEVRPGSRFELRARLFTAEGNEIAEFFSYRPHWTVVGAQLSVVERKGHTVVLEVPAGISTAVTSVDIVAEAGSTPVTSEPAKAVVVHSAPTEDHIVAEPRAGASLLIALAADALSSTTWDVSPVAFSGFASLGDLRTAGGIMVFSSDRAMAYSQNAIWTNSIDKFSYQSGAAAPQQDPNPLLVKEITLWIDPNASAEWPASKVEAIAHIQLAEANETLATNRVGVQLAVKQVYRITSGTPSSDDIHCSWTHRVTGVNDAGVPAVFDPSADNNTNAIDVFFFNMGIKTGWTCRESAPDASPGYRVFMNATTNVARLLGHELGHALLTTIGSVDHDNAADIGPSNLMIETCVADHCDQAPYKTHLSIGQACEMNRSSIVSALRGAVTPLPLPVPGKCPPITKDVP